MSERQHDPQAPPRRPSAGRRGFLEARLAPSARVWLRDAHRAAQARGLRATGLSIGALLLGLMGAATWAGSWAWDEPQAAWLGAFYMTIALALWGLHLRRPGTRRRRRG
jgi:hypothetical protein